MSRGDIEERGLLDMFNLVVYRTGSSRFVERSMSFRVFE